MREAQKNADLAAASQSALMNETTLELSFRTPEGEDVKPPKGCPFKYTSTPATHFNQRRPPPQQQQQQQQRFYNDLNASFREPSYAPNHSTVFEEEVEIEVTGVQEEVVGDEQAEGEVNEMGGQGLENEMDGQGLENGSEVGLEETIDFGMVNDGAEVLEGQGEAVEVGLDRQEERESENNDQDLEKGVEDVQGEAVKEGEVQGEEPGAQPQGAEGRTLRDRNSIKKPARFSS